MRVMLENYTDLTMKQIGNIMDRVREEGEGDTIYYGKVDKITLKHLNPDKDYIVTITYLKSYVKWIFTEVIV